MSAALDVSRDAAAYVASVRGICTHAGLPDLAARYIASNLAPDFVMLRLTQRYAEITGRPVPIIVQNEVQFP